MAQESLVRVKCDYCAKTAEQPSSVETYPNGWKQFAARRTAPTEDNGSFTIDLCSEHANDFLDFFYGRNGPHRVKVTKTNNEEFEHSQLKGNA